MFNHFIVVLSGTSDALDGADIVKRTYGDNLSVKASKVLIGKTVHLEDDVSATIIGVTFNEENDHEWEPITFYLTNTDKQKYFTDSATYSNLRHFLYDNLPASPDLSVGVNLLSGFAK